MAEDYNAYAPSVAPDGHWLAFQSDRTGRWEVYVRPFPNASDGEWTVSTNGGFAPRDAVGERDRHRAERLGEVVLRASYNFV